MKKTIICSFVLLICICASAWAQKKKSTASKTTATLSKAEKMGYARTNKYWGPGTYYCYAPGKPNNKMAVNAETDMRDLTGISIDDFYTEVAKQGFVEVPKKELKTWFKGSKSNDVKFFYSSDKSFILQPGIKDMYNSPNTETGKPALAISSVMRYVLIPEKDSTKVIDAIWQYMRDLNEMNVILSSFSSDFKKADSKAYPIQRAGSSGWTSMRAGSFVLKMVDGKPKGYWENNEAIIRRTIGMPEFHLVVLGEETDFGYMLQVKLQKEGYVLSYSTVAITINNLEPGNTWIKEYPHHIEEYQSGLKGDKAAIELYKKSPLPPVLLSMDKLLHR
jgi:hypothetical protein